MQYRELTSSSTFTLKTGPGYLQGITINLPWSSSPTLQIFDNVAASGNAIGGGSAAFAMPAAGTYMRYDCNFSAGLTIVVGGSTGAVSITVTYY